VNGALLAAASGGATALGLSLRFNWWRPKRPGTPILMHHQIGPHRPGSPLNRSRVTERDFDWQLDTLQRLGYRGVALRDLVDSPEEKSPSARRVVLTFDDGYRGVKENALRALQARGFLATVSSSRIGSAA
jgi:hypothetical protein